jgi:hypothetical protein
MSKFIREDNFIYNRKRNIDFGRIKTIQFFEKVKKFKADMKLKNKMKELEMKKNQKDNEINWNLRSKDELYQSKFKRNPFDLKENSANQFNFKKHHQQIEFADRNMTKNRLNFALSQIALHFVKVKSKLNLKKDIFNEIKNAISNNIKKTKTISKRYSLFHKSNKSLNFDNNNTEHKKIHDSNNKINNFYNKTENNFYPILISQDDDNIENIENNNNSKILDEEEENLNKKEKIIKNKSKKIFHIAPIRHGKNYYFIKKLGKFPHSRLETDYSTNNYNNNNNSINNIKHLKIKLKNKPYYTNDIEDIIKEYYKINNQIEQEKNCFIKRKFHPYEEIEEMMNIRKELKLFNLKSKYLSLNFSRAKNNTKKNDKKKIFNTIYTYCRDHEIDDF